MTSGGNGKVYLIGAGPGDPGLITVRGRHLLRQCDAVVYDNLVSPILIITLPEETALYYVGKQAGDHPVPQEEINQLTLRLAREGKTVARLKGSDPLIFGRGGEEARFLREHQVAFEIVPGVTSGIAGPAYAGIPCTDRERSSFVLFVTGHKVEEKSTGEIDWEWVARAKDGTLVIYMGVAEIGSLVEKLKRHGMPGNLPAAIIERGTLPSQRVVTTSLEQLPAIATAYKIKPPALFVIGRVVELRPWLEWFSSRPLMGLRVMVTRTASQADGLYTRLWELGAEPLPYPTIAFRSHDDPGQWSALLSLTGDNRWLIFTSETGVGFFFEQISRHGQDIRFLARFSVAAVGAGTAEALRACRIEPDFIPTEANVEALARELPMIHNLNGAVVGRVRGNLAETTIEDSFLSLGVRVIPLTVYETYHPAWPDDFAGKLAAHPPDAILFTSGSTMDGLYHNLGRDKADRIVAAAAVFSIGPKTSQRLKAQGVKITCEAKRQSIDGLLDELCAFYKDRRPEK